MAGPRNKTKIPAYKLADETEKISKRAGKEIENRLNGVELSNKTIFHRALGGELPRVKARSDKQRAFLKLIEDNEITLCKGPAGTGKSYLAVYKAFQLLSDLNNNYEQIIITTPAVEADEKLGFLPGTIEEKLDPYVFSTYYLMKKIIGESAMKTLIDKKVIVIYGLGYLRGINIDNAILLGEEIQNTTIPQIKTLLSRIGTDCKFILSGDMDQSDRFKQSKLHECGLAFVVEHLQGIEGIGTFEFGKEDIVRNKIISVILDRFKEQGK